MLLLRWFPYGLLLFMIKIRLTYEAGELWRRLL